MLVSQVNLMHVLAAGRYCNVFAVGDREVSSIGRGICVLLGISREDTSKEAEWM